MYMKPSRPTLGPIFKTLTIYFLESESKVLERNIIFLVKDIGPIILPRSKELLLPLFQIMIRPKLLGGQRSNTLTIYFLESESKVLERNIIFVVKDRACNFFQESKYQSLVLSLSWAYTRQAFKYFDHRPILLRKRVQCLWVKVWINEK